MPNRRSLLIAVVIAGGLLGSIPVRAATPVIVGSKGGNGAKQHVVALRDDGRVFTWGSDSNGQLGDGPPPPVG